jgi:hypothetical protein
MHQKQGCVTLVSTGMDLSGTKGRLEQSRMTILEVVLGKLIVHVQQVLPVFSLLPFFGRRVLDVYLVVDSNRTHKKKCQNGEHYLQGARPDRKVIVVV